MHPDHIHPSAPSTWTTTDMQRPRLSISAIRRMLTCGESERLIRAGYRQQPTAAMWYGRLMHEIIALAYNGTTLPDAFMEVWTRECGGILPVLDQWAVLHADRRINGGRAGTKARASWDAAHGQYDVLTAQIAAYQTHVLGHYRWTKTGSVGELYERSSRLLHEHGGSLRLPGAVLVEGRLIADLPPGSSVRDDAIELGGSDDDDDERRYARLRGLLGGTEVIGVPDVVTYDAEVDVWRVADYKTTKSQLSLAELRDDVQLQLYVHLVRQAGIIPVGARVIVGHIYLSDVVTPIWIDAPDMLDAPHPRLLRQIDLIAGQIERDEFVPVRGVLNGWADRCGDCLLTHVCRV